MSRNLNILLWVIFFALMAPSGMVLASWNAVPGDGTYGMKIGLEKVLLFVLSPSNELQSTTNSKLTERRLGEVTRVLSGVHAKESLDNLEMQIDSTRASLYGIEDEVAKREAILKYIQTLHQVSSELENQKLTRSLAYIPPRQPVTSYRIPPPPSGNGSTTTKQQVTYVTNYYTQPQSQPPAGQPPTGPQQPVQTTAPVAQPVQTSSPAPSPAADETITPEVAEDITETQDEIDEVIEDLTDAAEEIEATLPEESPSPSPEETSPEPSPVEEPSPNPTGQTGGGQGQGQGQGQGGGGGT